MASELLVIFSTDSWFDFNFTFYFLRLGNALRRPKHERFQEK